ncbi:hypothetical protein [Actinocrispum sp. NPDC049592]|uniref:hypothetical protein n=1 Tax=Actinocrispum sp. NPDC049592 TaxID=3154835 RepID=UPI00341ED66F
MVRNLTDSMHKLYELMSRYSSIDEVWWDMANPTGRNQPLRAVTACCPSARRTGPAPGAT